MTDDKTKTDLEMECVRLRRKLMEAEQRAEWARGHGALTDKERRILDMWPRFEDTGEPVWFGDELDFGGDVQAVKELRIMESGCAIADEFDYEEHFEHGQRVKRPVPEVLDAGGAPIKEGDTVYEADAGEEYEVEHIFSNASEPDYPDHTVRCRKKSDFIEHMFKPDQLTHAKPVLDRYGKPIKVGDTVWFEEMYDVRDEMTVVGLKDDRWVRLECTDGEHAGNHLVVFSGLLTNVKPVLDANGDRIRVGDTVWHEDGTEWLVEKPEADGVLCFDGEVRRTFDPDKLTHREPDSWEKWERDLRRGETCEEACGELIRRAKALAGVEQ